MRGRHGWRGAGLQQAQKPDLLARFLHLISSFKRGAPSVNALWKGRRAASRAGRGEDDCRRDPGIRFRGRVGYRGLRRRRSKASGIGLRARRTACQRIGKKRPRMPKPEAPSCITQGRRFAKHLVLDRAW